MFWRYLFLICLLVGPSDRIFTQAAAETFDDLASEQDVVDRIMLHLGEDQNGGLDKKGNGPPDISNNDKPAQNENPPIVGSPPDTVNAAQEAPTGSSGAAELPQPSAQRQPAKSKDDDDDDDDTEWFLAIVTGCAVFGFIGLMLAGVCYYKYRKGRKAATNVEYPAYGVTGPMKERVPSPGDRKLAQSAQMYHYQHQKQQMIAMEKANGDMKHDASDDDSEEDNIEGDYTVYECPGLAPTGEMEVKNPLFRGDETPVSPNKDPSAPPAEDVESASGAEH